jgi:1,4-dihydroxy-2-naphthoyl-CoA synthase
MATSNPQLVRYERRQHVATITLNRPEKRNAFNAVSCELSVGCWPSSTVIRKRA